MKVTYKNVQFLSIKERHFTDSSGKVVEYAQGVFLDFDGNVETFNIHTNVVPLLQLREYYDLTLDIRWANPSNGSRYRKFKVIGAIPAQAEEME